MKPRQKMISVMRAKSNAAFTFIELLIVIIIIGILLGLSMPQLRRSFDNLELDNFVKNLYYLAQYLEASAISQGKIHCLNILQEEGRFWATYRENNADEFKRIAGRFGNEYKAPAGINVNISGINPKDIASVYFYPDGSTSAVTIDFQNKHNQKASLVSKGAAGGIKIPQAIQ